MGRRYISFNVRGRFRKLSLKGYFFFLHSQENKPLDMLFSNPNSCEFFFLKLNKIDFQRKNFACPEVTHLVGSNLPSPQKRIKKTSHSRDFPSCTVAKTLQFYCSGHEFHHWSGTKTHMSCSQKKRKKTSHPNPKCFTISSWRQKLVDPHIREL